MLQNHLLRTAVLLVALSCGQIQVQAQTETEAQGQQVKLQRFRVAINGGIGYRTASTDESKEALIDQGFAKSEVNRYFRQIKWGPKASAQAHYLFLRKFGLGIDYQFYYSSGDLAGIIDSEDGITRYQVAVNDDIYTNYIGFSFLYHDWLIAEKLKYYAQASTGIALYRQETTNKQNGAAVLTTGNAVGGNIETGMEYFIHPNIALAAHLNFFTATLTRVKINNGRNTVEKELEDEQREGLSRYDTGIGLRFYF